MFGYENEEVYGGTTRHISKRIITTNGIADTTYKGGEVLSCSITPSGVAKATVNQKKGIITFEKYDPAWNGEISLNLETIGEGNSDEHYINDYTVQFNGIGFDDAGSDELEAFDYNEIQTLSGDEEEDTTGGAGKMVPALAVSKSSIDVKVGSTTKLTCKYTGDGRISVTSSNPAILSASISGKIITIIGKKAGTAVLSVTSTATVKYKAVCRKIVVTVK